MNSMKLYDENGYLCFDEILKTKLPFIFIVGGRGSGKTYGALKYFYEHDICFMYLRRTQAQIDLVSKPEYSPFKKINSDLGISIESKSISKYTSGFYNHDLETDTFTLIGYSAALSTFANVRGADLSDSKALIFDEFIPEKHERLIKCEADAFFNAYETINRNRELDGDEPLQAVCLANANDLGNPIFLSLGLVSIAERMAERGKDVYINRNRGIGLFILTDSPVSDKKRKTSLYNLTSGSEFEKMAINNDFVEEKSRSESKRLIEYKPIVAVGEICIYKHKSKQEFYISEHVSGSPAYYGSGDTGLKRFRHDYIYLWREYLRNHIIFEKHVHEILFNRYFGH